MNSRQQTILQMVIDQGQVSVTDLAKATGVSEVTIRQDLNTLEKLSYLRRAHGFAVSLDSDDVETRMMSNYTLKRELAEFAASLVQRAKPSLSKMAAAMPCSPGLWASRRKMSLSSRSAATSRIC
ncbi:DeoR-family transcriptional regulator [Escherichia coli]|uniref:DeoR-family transcriptional regulator n=1 Tax=Escherichia coli TaxID=562 RepID=A0A376MWB9_ECOLX|nr:DeoR-family transcriptional regulator [Escherichia coli]